MLPTYIKRHDGSVFINPAKPHVPPFWLLTDTNAVVLAAGVTSPPQMMTVDNQGHFEAFYSMAEKTGPATINIFDPGTRRFLMNRECHMDTICGGVAGTAARTPFIWPESYFMNVEDAGRALQVTFRDLSGAPNTIRFSLHGRRFYTKESPPEVYQKMYQYFGRKERTNTYFLTTDAAVTIPANGVATAFARVTDEADFEIFKISSVQDGDYTFTLRDASTGRTLNNFGQIHVDLGSGDGDFPFIFVEPWLVRRNYLIQIDFTDLSGAPNDVFFTMTGRRLYYAQ